MEKGKQKKGLRMGSIVAALVAAIALFLTMLRLEKDMLEDYEKGTVFTAARQIPKGLVITGENRMDYFEEKEMDKECIPETALTDVEQMKGRAAVFDIGQGVVLAEGMFEDVNEITRNMKAPTIAGCKADDLYQIVGGILRAGDRVHIYAVPDEGEARLIWQNVYVQQVFDNSGSAIPNEDREKAAQRINVYLEKEDVKLFYSELAHGSLRVVKVCD